LYIKVSDCGVIVQVPPSAPLNRTKKTNKDR
jgi:hypothetical protein